MATTRQLRATASTADLASRVEELEQRVARLETPAPAKKAAPKPAEK